MNDNKIDIKDLVRKAGTQKHVAESLGVSLRAVTYWTDGSRDPSYRHFLQLCRLAKHDPRSVRTE
jgi:DNA-binding transcriptional regulator YiaG